MKPGFGIHLEELRSTICSILSLDLLFSSPELKASGQLIGWEGSVVCIAFLAAAPSSSEVAA